MQPTPESTQSEAHSQRPLSRAYFSPSSLILHPSSLIVAPLRRNPRLLDRRPQRLSEHPRRLVLLDLQRRPQPRSRRHPRMIHARQHHQPAIPLEHQSRRVPPGDDLVPRHALLEKPQHPLLLRRPDIRRRVRRLLRENPQPRRLAPPRAQRLRPQLGLRLHHLHRGPRRSDQRLAHIHIQRPHLLQQLLAALDLRSEHLRLRHLLSALCHPPSAICYPPSAIRYTTSRHIIVPPSTASICKICAPQAMRIAGVTSSRSRIVTLCVTAASCRPSPINSRPDSASTFAHTAASVTQVILSPPNPSRATGVVFC